MRFLSRLTGRDHPQHRTTNKLAAQRIDTTGRANRRDLGNRQRWQTAAWDAYEAVGEIGYLVNYRANAISRLRLFPAVQSDDPEEGRVPLEAVEGIPGNLIAQAALELARIRSLESGQAEVMRQMSINADVPGEGFLIGRMTDDGEEWEVASTEAVDVDRRRWVVRRWKGDREGVALTTEDAFFRFWVRDPRWSGLATSPMKGILGHAEELQLLERMFRGMHRSAIAGREVIVFPSEMNLSGTSRSGGSLKEGDFIDDFITFSTTALEDEASVAAFSPYFMDAPGQFLDKIQKIAIGRTLTEAEERRETQLLKRVAQGMDVPPELLTGMADVNHWTAWQVSDDTYQAHIEPSALRIADFLAAAVLRPALLEAGFPRDIVAEVTVGVNADELLSRPNREVDAKSAHEALVISDEALRAALRFTDADAPTEDELLRRMALKRGISTEQLTRDLLREYVDANITAVAVQPPEPDQGAADDTPAAEDDTDEPGPPELEAAATVRTLGDTLADIDRRLTDRLTVAAEAAVNRAVERAGNQLRTAARRGPLAAQLDGVPAHLVASTLGAARSTLGIEDTTLINETVFAELATTWDTEVAGAFTAATEAVRSTTGQTPAVDAERAEDDRSRGWVVLMAGLVVLATARLDSPTVVAEPGGEDVPSGQLPPSVIRQSLAVAGGALGQVTAGGAVLVDAGSRPAGGVATGENVLDAIAALDDMPVLTGWRWSYGFPSRPFEPHRALHGTTFTDWDDPVLANHSGDWPYVAHYYPGDHRGCRCTEVPVFAFPSRN